MFNFIKKIFTSEDIQKEYFNHKNFKLGRFAIQCKSEDDLMKLAKYLDYYNVGFVPSGKLFKNEANWKEYDKYTCYSFNCGVYRDHLGYYLRKGIKVVDFNEIDDLPLTIHEVY